MTEHECKWGFRYSAPTPAVRCVQTQQLQWSGALVSIGNTQIARSESTYRRTDNSTGNGREKLDARMGVPLPKRGLGLDSVALAYFESVLLHNFRGLADQLAAEQCKTPDRKLPAWIPRSCLGTLGGKTAVPGYVGELIWLENPTQMVRPCNRAA